MGHHQQEMRLPQIAPGLSACYDTSTSHDKEPAQAVLVEAQSRATEEHVVKAVSEEETPKENNCAVDVAEAFELFVQDAVEAKCHERIQELEEQNKELEEQKKKLEEDAKTEKCCAMAAAIIANEKARRGCAENEQSELRERIRKKTLRQAWLEIFFYIILCIFFL